MQLIRGQLVLNLHLHMSFKYIIVSNKYKQLEISKLLINWYEENKRILPWRETIDSYKIWISEIILQQTRVAQGLEYYIRFIKRYPSIHSLAESSEEDVLKEWQGLGYYSRARNLHTAAKLVVREYNGILPDNYKEIITLKGIGEYTAAAILSTAYNKPYAVVDGNVYRVLSRLFAIDTPIDSSKGKKQFTQLAQDLLDIENPGNHNQALMEFGALHCTPSQPQCSICPMKQICIAKQLNKQTQYPVKERKTKIRSRFFHYFRIIDNGFTYLNKRVENDIWRNMYEFPLIETNNEISFIELTETSAFKSFFHNSDVTFHVNQKQVKHVLTHQHIYTNFYEVITNKDDLNLDTNFLKIKIDDLHKYPISRLIHRYLERITD